MSPASRGSCIASGAALVSRFFPWRGHRTPARNLERHLSQHYWVRPDDTPAAEFLTGFLETRGVSTIPIDSWSGSSFAELIDDAFGSRSNSGVG